MWFLINPKANSSSNWCPESYSCVGSNPRFPWFGSTLLPELPCPHSLQKRVGLGTSFVLFGILYGLGMPSGLRPSFGLLLCGFGAPPCPEGVDCLFGIVVGFDAALPEETGLLLFLVMVYWILMTLLWDNFRSCIFRVVFCLSLSSYVGLVVIGCLLHPFSREVRNPVL